MEPFTGNSFRVPYEGVGKVVRIQNSGRGTPGRKPDSIPPARSAWQAEFVQRIRIGRESLAQQRGHDISYPEMAKLLSQSAGYYVNPDNYRKYESATSQTMMPHDLLFHFSDVTGVSLARLLSPLPLTSRKRT